MKVTRILSLILALALLAPMFAIGQEETQPNPTAVAVAETVAKTATDGAVEVAKDATAQVVEAAQGTTAEARQAVANAVEAITPSATAKQQILDALLGFLQVGRDTLEDGMELAKNGVVAAGEFAGTQIPLVLTELIMLRRAETLVKFLATIFVGVLVLYLGRKLWKWVNDPENKELKGSQAEGTFALLAIIMQALSVVVPIMVIIANMREWILPWIAPRIYLIEYMVQIIDKLK